LKFKLELLHLRPLCPHNRTSYCQLAQCRDQHLSFGLQKFPLAGTEQILGKSLLFFSQAKQTEKVSSQTAKVWSDNREHSAGGNHSIGKTSASSQSIPAHQSSKGMLSNDQTTP